jgi:L-serine deaminase
MNESGNAQRFTERDKAHARAAKQVTAHGAKHGTVEGAPVAGTAGLAPLVISLDPHAAEMIVALREIFPHAEISIDKDNG